MTTASATFSISSWDEDTYEDLDGPAKLTKATAGQSFSGDIEGDGVVTWLMSYAADDDATFVGLMRVTGKLGDREGSVVLTSTGTFDGAVAKGPLTVLQGFGSLAGITGSGELVAPLAGEPSVTLEYELG
jgi:hypothetical protein